MIISHSRKFVFVHIQKNAGTSITKYLDKHLTYQDLLLGCNKFGESINRSYRKKFGLHKHAHAIKIKDVMGDETWNSYFSFSFVRNPYDRIVSLYNWCRKGKFKFPECQAALQAENFSQFIRSECFQQLPNQLKYLTDTEGNIIVDFIGRQESIQEDFDRVCQKLGIPSDNMNKARHSFRTRRPQDNYQSYFKSDEDLELVRNQFSSDLDFFGYEF